MSISADAVHGEWCTGDMRAGPAGDMTTTFIVREPDATPEDHTDNPIADVYSPRSFPPHDPERGPTVAQLLHPSDGVADPEALIDPDDDRDSVAEVFRRLVTVCTVPAEAVLAGDYLLQIRANAGTDPLRADPSGRSGGHNRMSVRAVRTEGGTASGAGIVVGGHDVALTTNDRGHSPGVIALPIRSVPVTPGGTLELSLFDLSDGRDGRALATDPSRCSIQYRRGGLNERLLTIRGPAPPGCGTTTDGSCSLRVVLTSLTPAGIHDTISFGAAIRTLSVSTSAPHRSTLSAPTRHSPNGPSPRPSSRSTRPSGQSNRPSSRSTRPSGQSNRRPPARSRLGEMSPRDRSASTPPTNRAGPAERHRPDSADSRRIRPRQRGPLRPRPRGPLRLGSARLGSAHRSRHDCDASLTAGRVRPGNSS